jgi:hypothetical protein
MKSLSHVIWVPSRDSNRVPREYKSEEVLLEPICLASHFIRPLFILPHMKALLIIKETMILMLTFASTHVSEGKQP